MSTATAPQSQQNAKPTTAPNGSQKLPPVAELTKLLDQVLQSTPTNVVAQSIEKTLMANVDRMQSALPDQLKPEAARLIRRAAIYFQNGTEKLRSCSPVSFMQCVLKAAEIGLPLDGKLCHAVPFNNKKQDANGRDIWVMEATCMPDYKGLIAVAKRNNVIIDVFAEIVCEFDEFEFERTEAIDTLRHKFSLSDKRGSVIGCYSKVQLPSGGWRFDIMTRDDIDSIRAKSKAVSNGPWKDVESSDWREMAKKTGIKRMLKGFQDDPGLARAIELDDAATGYTLENAGIVPTDTRSKTERLTERLTTPKTAEAQPPTDSISESLGEQLADAVTKPTDHVAGAGKMIETETQPQSWFVACGDVLCDAGLASAEIEGPADNPTGIIYQLPNGTPLRLSNNDPDAYRMTWMKKRQAYDVRTTDADAVQQTRDILAKCQQKAT